MRLNIDVANHCVNCQEALAIAEQACTTNRIDGATEKRPGL
jgi:predicted nucleic acid-binding Zn ribbon protein